MNRYLLLSIIAAGLFLAGCETVHDTTKEAGTYVGKGMDAAGGVTEGAAEGYGGTEPTQEENPYQR